VHLGARPPIQWSSDVHAPQSALTVRTCRSRCLIPLIVLMFVVGFVFHFGWLLLAFGPNIAWPLGRYLLVLPPGMGNTELQRQGLAEPLD
jgi:hypothetical protein